MKTKPLTSRRSFIKTTLGMPIALAASPVLETRAAPAAAAVAGELPRRKLGDHGPDVTMLNIGGMMTCLSAEFLDIAWSMGIRYFDNADCYVKGKSETFIGDWLRKHPEKRKEVFIATKDHPRGGPEQLLEMIDRRLERLGTNYVDIFYIHGINPREYGEDSLTWPKSDRFKRVAEKLKSSGKCKMVGFTCHDPRLVDYINAAAEGKFVDAIMLRYTPFFQPGDPLDRALDACHKVGIGLVAMKTMRNLGDVPKRIPEFDKLGLNTHQAVLHACWTDHRIASVCSMLNNVDQIECNTTAARTYKTPLKFAHKELLRQTILAHRRTMCPGCPSCDAAAAHTEFAFQDIARFVTYYEQDGNLDAHDFYHALPLSARDASGVDLAALRESCAFGVDYEDIIARARRCFA